MNSQMKIEQINFDTLSFEPAEWFVCFHRQTESRWVGRLAWGRFKHVSAFGYVKGSDTWVFYDHFSDRGRVFSVPDFIADKVFPKFVDGNVVLKIERPLRQSHPFHFRPGLWCVPMVAHLVGIRSWAFRPDAFYRDCLKLGAKLIVGSP